LLGDLGREGWFSPRQERCYEKQHFLLLETAGECIGKFTQGKQNNANGTNGFIIDAIKHVISFKLRKFLCTLHPYYSHLSWENIMIP
jgi:hypothetical protein